MIMTIKSMFCHSMQWPLYSSNYTELKQNEQSSHLRCLCAAQVSSADRIYKLSNRETQILILANCLLTASL